MVELKQTLFKPFSYLYDKTIAWAGHIKAPYYLALVSFAESSFFPIPPDVMLISMGLAKPKKAWIYAFIVTLFSVLGGILGYAIGFYAIDILHPYILASSYAPSYLKITHWFENSGVWLVIGASFTPFPYKIFTIAAGAMQMALFPFLLGSIIGRGARFFLVSTLLYFVGAHLQTALRRNIDRFGWILLAVLIVGYGVWQWIL